MGRAIKPPSFIGISYRTESEAREVAQWLAAECERQCGGIWYPRWHENLGWHTDARLGDPFIASVNVWGHHGKLHYHGGFTSAPGSVGWSVGDSANGDSPLEVMRKSYEAIVGKANRLLQRLHEVNVGLKDTSILGSDVTKVREAAIQALRLLELEK